jgi:hypothetical protein
MSVYRNKAGETSTATNGQQMTIIKYRGANDIDIQFEDGTIVYNKDYSAFKRGNVLNPNKKVKKHDVHDRTGETSTASNGQTMEIIEYRHSNDIDIKFEDGTVVKGRSYDNFKKGKVENPNKKTKDNELEKTRALRIGETAMSHKGQLMTIIEYRSATDIDVQFEDGTIAKHKWYRRFKDGHIKGRAIDRTGETGVSATGQPIEIIRYDSVNDYDVKFDDGTVVHSRRYSDFKSGRIRKPSEIKYISERKSERLGETSTSTMGETMTIIRYGNTKSVDIRFEDGTVVLNRKYKDFKNGLVKNPNNPYVKDTFTSRIGEINTATNGQQIKIIAYRGSLDVDVEFEDGTIVEHRTYKNFKKGMVENPNNRTVRKKIIDKTGETSTATNGQTMEIIAYRGSADIDVKFEDGTVVERRCYKAFKNGNIANPNQSVKRGRKPKPIEIEAEVEVKVVKGNSHNEETSTK